MKKFYFVFFIFSITFLAMSVPAEEASKDRVTAQDAQAAHYIKVEGIVNPVMAEYIIKSLEDAAGEGAVAAVIQLDTPGGLDLSMRDIVKAILASETPVVVYVAPAGARAASAGVFIMYASHVAAMAPGTNIGSAHPVAMGGEKMDEVMVKKVENDAVAYIKSIAKKKKRNEDWAEKAVRVSANITAEEALKLGVIEIIAENRDELMKKLDLRKVETVSKVVTLSTKGAVVKDVEMNLRFRILNAITNPNVAYILMMIGLIGIYFELSNPGAILPGVVGAISLVLAFYAFQTLSVNYAGLVLIGLAFIFFIAEIKVTSFGLLAIAGVISLTLGSLMLFESPLPFMRVSLWVLLPTVVVFTFFILAMMYYALRIFKRKPFSGIEGLSGETGIAATDIGTRGGEVFVEGEYWKAVSDSPIENGSKVTVIEVKGLVLKVVKSD